MTAIEEIIEWCKSNAFNIEGQDGVKFKALDFEEMGYNFDDWKRKESEDIASAYNAGCSEK